MLNRHRQITGIKRKVSTKNSSGEHRQINIVDGLITHLFVLIDNNDTYSDTVMEALVLQLCVLVSRP